MGLKKEFWEVDGIDLNLRHYSGNPSDVIKKIKGDIEQYLANPNVLDEQRRIYSAVYNALEYYSNVSYIQPAEFSTEDSFLSYAINLFNDDYKYLSKKYNPKDPTKPPVITFSARIKSPASFVEKMKEKITEYVRENRDLGFFNESLRDLLGARIIVNPPQRIKDQGQEAECAFLYRVLYDLMYNHGINRRNQEDLSDGNFRFININTRHDPTKMEKIQNRANVEGYSKNIIFGENGVYIPQKRIPEIEVPHISSKLKDYVKYPKFSGYQSIHICVTPNFSEFIEHPLPPVGIIPPSTYDFFIEYQFRTERQNEFAEHGNASHKETYKPHQVNYHRLAVPFYIEIDGPQDISDNFYSGPVAKRSSIIPQASRRLKLRNFAESYERFYGHTFQDRFGISFKDFRDSFGTEEREDILALKKQVIYDAEQGRYYTVPAEKTLILTHEEQERLSNLLSSHPTSMQLMTLLDELGLLDNLISPSTTKKKSIEDAQTRKSQIAKLIFPIANPGQEFAPKEIRDKAVKPTNPSLDDD